MANNTQKTSSPSGPAGGMVIVNGATGANPPQAKKDSPSAPAHAKNPSVTFTAQATGVANQPAGRPNLKFGSVDAGHPDVTPTAATPVTPAPAPAAAAAAPVPATTNTAAVPAKNDASAPAAAVPATANAAAAASNNPRVSSPAQSPTPIPPATSGGVPPSSNMNMSFGNFGGGDDNNRRHLPGPASHFRRESGQSSGDNNHHNSPHPHSIPRGGYRGRGGGYHNNGGSHHGNNYNNSPGASFRNMNHGGRGGANNANNNANNNPGAAASGGPRGNAGYTGSPHQGFRSPAMNQATPVPNYPGAAAAPGMPGYAVPAFPGGPMAPMHHVRNLSLNLSTSPITPTMEGSTSGNTSANVVATPAIATKDGGGGGNGGNDGNGNGNGSRTTETAHYTPSNANHGNRRGYRGGRYGTSWAARRKRESGSSCRSSFDSSNFPTPFSQHQKFPSDTPSNYPRNPRSSHNRHRESFGSGHHPPPRETLPFHSQFSELPNYPSPQSCSQATSDQSRCFSTPSSQGHPNSFPPGFPGFPGSQPMPMNIPYMNEDSLTYHFNSQGYPFDPNASAFQYGNPYGFMHQMPYPPSPAPPPMAQQTQSPQAHFRGLSAANVAAAPFIPGRSTFPQQQQSQPPIPGSVPPGSVPPMAASMARTPSQMSHSAERPGSSVGPVPIPAAAQPPSGPVVGSPVPHPATMAPAPMTPIHHHVTPHHAHTPSLTRGSPTSVAAPSMNPIPQPFSPSAPRTAKRSSALVIKDPKTGKELDFKPSAGSAKGTSQNTPASNASPAKSASGKASPSPAAGVPANEEKKEEQAASAKQSEEETRKEFQAGVLARLKAEKEQKEREEREAKEAKEAEEKKQKEEAEAAERKKKEEEEAEQKKKQEAEEAEKKKAAEAAAKKEAEEKAEREKKEAEEKKKADDEAAAKKKEEDDKAAAAAAAEAEKKPAETPAPAAAEAAPADEEDEFERMVREMEEKEKADIAAEEAYNEKKRKEKEEAEAKKKAEEAAYWADTKRAEAEAEALEEAREKKREAERRAAAGLPPVEEKKGASKLFENLKAKQAASAAGTDASSMPPPAKPAAGLTGKRDKPPSTLKIDSTKSVEPPQASAALKSLQSAHFLSDPFKIDYPSPITAPDAELNANAPADKKFKYNKEFLLQFQNVVKEKPSLDWDQRVKETVGDTSSQDSGRAMSSRGGSSRQGSRAGPTPSHHGPRAPMGAFGGSTMDPARMGAMGNMGSFMGGGFAGRTGSNIIPSSPRTGSRRGAGGRQDSKHNKQNRREDEHKNSNMPLTANMDIKPIQVSATGWKPRSVGAAAQSGPQPGGDSYLPPDVVQRKVKAALNKMTPENFDRISDQILAIVAQSKDEDDGRTLRQVIQLTFEKATDEAHWAGLYARFCKRMLDSMSPEIKDTTILDKQGHVVSGGSLFRKYLLTRCQEEFERGWKNKLPKKPDGQTEEAALMSDEYYIAAAAKRRGLGLVKFIGELYKLGMLTERIMHQCVHKLVDFEGIPEEAEVESLCNLLKTIGYSLDASERGHTLMDVYFERVEMMMNIDGLPSRLRFMLMDIVDLRKSGWASKDAEKGPKTIQEIRAEAARAQQAQEMERARQQSHRGGRPAAGRGDARGYGGFNQPPPDNSRQVGSEDLRRLRANPRGQSSSPASFGPSTMFSRTSSGRGSMGPGGNLLRAADSRTNSRAGSSAGKTEKEEPSRSRNAFDALAALNDHENPVGSPPSNPTSPAMAKAKPDQAE